MTSTAFSMPDRTLTARIIIDGVTYGPEVISSIKFNRGVSLADQFEIGTAYAQVVSFDLLDEAGTLLEGKEFLRKRAHVEIGVLDSGTWVYQSMGSYLLEAPEKVQKILWRFEGADDMIRADIPFNGDAVTYPATVSKVFQSAVAQMGMTTDTTTFTNSSIVIDPKPVFYEMTVRELLADVAEIAGGYCFIEGGKVRLRSLAEDASVSVSSENIQTFRRNEDKNIKIDQVIIQQTGVDDLVYGVGEHPFYIADNVFVQGDAEDFAPALYGALNGIEFVPCEVEFNGNPTEKLNGWVNLEFLGSNYKVFPAAREIEFAGGMREKWISKPLDHKPPDPVAENIVRNIKKNQAQIRVTNEGISATVVKIVEETMGAIAPYQVDIISTGGLIFKNGVISTTLLARVYQNNVDITDDIDVSRFRWTKTNADGTPDTAWNDAVFGGVKQVTVTSEDIYRRATFTCQILN